MMSAYANSLQKPPRFDMYVRKLQSICVMHGVQIGSRTDLPAFMQKLVEDRHLAMDFWAFIGKLSNREGGELSDDQMLSVVIESIADGAIRQDDVGLKRSVDDLRAMLAGVDIQGPGQSHMEPAPFSRNDAGPQQGDGEGRSRSVVEFPLRGDEEAILAAVLPSTMPQRLEEELLRRELAKLLKQYFDDIDKRISKLEPPLEEAKSTGPVASATTRRSLEDPAPEEMEEQRLRRISRLVLEPDSFLQNSPEAEIHRPPIRVPLANYSEPAGYGKNVLVLLLVAWLIGAAFAVYPYRRPLRRGFVGWAFRAVQNNGPGTYETPGPPSTESSDEDSSLDEPEPGQISTSEAALSGTSTPSPIGAPNRNAFVGSRGSQRSLGSQGSLGSQSSQGSQAAGASFSPNTGNKAIPGRAPNQRASMRSQPGGSRIFPSSSATAERSPLETEPVAVERSEPPAVDNLSSAEAARLVQVDSSVMEANLIVSRVPAYPEAAKTSRVAGHVVMQAIIAEDGSVKRVHVTEGDSRLRAAAVEAVYKWRYRPYLVDGQPTEVTTTITVDFNP
jgi:TonB family protein